jgi:hypothetical protein
MSKNTLFLYLALGLQILLLSSCESTDIINVNLYTMPNEFCIVRTRKQVFNNEQKEVLSEQNDTIDFSVSDYFMSIAFERECNEGRLKNNETEKQHFYEATKKFWAEKVALQKRLLDSLVAFRDTIFFKENCDPKTWSKNNYSNKDVQYGWPYMQTEPLAMQQMKFLEELSLHKIHDTITFEYFYAQYWIKEKKIIEERALHKIDPSDIGPRVRCSGRVRTTSFSVSSGSNVRYTSCSAYTNSKSGRCSYH